MPRTLKSLLMLAALLAGTASALTGCVVLPYDGYGYRGGYWNYDHHRDHDDWGRHDRYDRRR